MPLKNATVANYLIETLWFIVCLKYSRRILPFLASFFVFLLLLASNQAWNWFFFGSDFLHIKLYLTCSMSMLCLLSLYKALHVGLKLNCICLISIAISIVWFQNDIPLCLRIFCKEICLKFGSFDASSLKKMGSDSTYFTEDFSACLTPFSLICF